MAGVEQITKLDTKGWQQSRVGFVRPMVFLPEEKKAAKAGKKFKKAKALKLKHPKLWALATYMEKGLKWTEPADGEWVAGGNEKEFAACALGAAYLGFIGKDKAGGDSVYNLDRKAKAWSSKYSTRVPCPTSLGGWDNSMSASKLVMTLNDDEGWSRKRIASYLKRVAVKGNPKAE